MRFHFTTLLNAPGLDIQCYVPVFSCHAWREEPGSSLHCADLRSCWVEPTFMKLCLYSTTGRHYRLTDWLTLVTANCMCTCFNKAQRQLQNSGYFVEYWERRTLKGRKMSKKKVKDVKTKCRLQHCMFLPLFILFIQGELTKCFHTTGFIFILNWINHISAECDQSKMAAA